MRGPIKWRWLEERDSATVATLHAAMERRIGKKLQLPNLMERPIIAAIIGETDGAVTHCLYLEAEAEVCAASPEPLSAKQMAGAMELLMPTLQHYKIQIVRAYVPEVVLSGKRGRKGAVVRLLEAMGFTRENNSVAQFYRWIKD